MEKEQERARTREKEDKERAASEREAAEERELFERERESRAREKEECEKVRAGLEQSINTLQQGFHTLQQHCKYLEVCMYTHACVYICIVCMHVAHMNICNTHPHHPPPPLLTCLYIMCTSSCNLPKNRARICHRRLPPLVGKFRIWRRVMLCLLAIRLKIL